MQTALKVKLSIFMFLQYFIWGSWYMTLSTYLGEKGLGFEGWQIGLAYGAFAIGAMISPFFIGLIADRYFASEKMLGVLGLLGGVMMFILPQMRTFDTFYPTLILYCATYVPTLALGNSLSLHQLRDAKRDFPQVKIFSAVGWIGGGAVLSFVFRGEVSAIQYYQAGVVSIVFGLFAFTLPHTPPKKVGRDVSLGQILGLDALALMRRRSFAVFVVCMFLICIPLYFYFVNMAPYLQELKWKYVGGPMTLAQVSDVIFLFLLPVMLWRLGYKITITIGILAWITRYFLLAASVDSALALQYVLIFGAILLHGVCYDFLFIAGQLYVDDESNERMRGAAQGFIAFILWGVGNFVGSWLAGRVQGSHKYSEPTGQFLHDWQNIWIIPAIGASAVLIVFLIFFRNPPARPVQSQNGPENPTIKQPGPGA